LVSGSMIFSCSMSARPPVRDDERQRSVIRGADMNEVNVKPVDFRHELWGVGLRLKARQSQSVPNSQRVPGSSRRHACESSVTVAIGPAHRGDPATHVIHRFLRRVDLKGGRAVASTCRSCGVIQISPLSPCSKSSPRPVVRDNRSAPGIRCVAVPPKPPVERFHPRFLARRSLRTGVSPWSSSRRTVVPARAPCTTAVGDAGSSFSAWRVAGRHRSRTFRR
jgi:hypothetical protein